MLSTQKPISAKDARVAYAKIAPGAGRLPEDGVRQVFDSPAAVDSSARSVWRARVRQGLADAYRLVSSITGETERQTDRWVVKSKVAPAGD